MRKLIFVLCWLASARALAVHNDRRFERIGSAEGLSEPNVRAIAQDAQGFLWFGTSEGLNRFDGRSMVVYRRDPADPATLPSNRVSALLTDSRGTLWVGTRGGGLSRFDARTERFETFRFDPADPASLSQNDVAAIVEDRRGRIWVGTMRGGVNRIDLSDPRRPRFIRLQHEDQDASSLSDDRTRSLLVDARDRLWVGTMSGINRLESEAPVRFIHYRHEPQRADSLGDDEVWALEQDGDGTIWAGTWGGGVSRLKADAADAPGGRFLNIALRDDDSFGLSNAVVTTIVEDGQGTLWIGTQEQLNELLPSERQKERPRFIHHAYDVNDQHSLPADGIAVAFEDRAGDLWFGTDGGLSHLDRAHGAFKPLVQDRSDPLRLGAGNVAQSVLQDRRGILWIGTSKGLDRVLPSGDRFVPDQVTHFTREDSSVLAGPVVALLEDRRGSIWIGSAGEGLGIITADQVSVPRPAFATFLPDPAVPGSLASDAVLSLLEDAQGNVWVGTYRGLHRAIIESGPLPSGFTRFRHDRSDDSTLSADTIEALAVAPDGGLWVGTYRGLNWFDPKTGKARRYLPDPLRPRSLSHEFVDDVHVDAAGTLWVATYGGGLCRLVTASDDFDLFGTREGLPSESVKDIAGSRDGLLWIGTSRGLVRLDPHSRKTRLFDADNGLGDDVVSALGWMRNGELMVAGASGVTYFDPDALMPGKTPPPVSITGLRVLHEPARIGGDVLQQAIGFTERIVLRPKHSHFTIDFGSASYRDPEALRYEYRLEGHDDHWIPVTANERRAVFSNVPPGKYRFLVRAGTEDGVWSSKPASLAVTVLPPWWKTWWARAMALVLLISFSVSLPLVRLARQRRISAMLETRVRERTAQLEEANRRLDEASRTDLLTGLPNRRHFLEKGEEQAIAFRRHGRPFAVGLADVDNFKSVNDTWGHDAGDAVLRAVAGTLRETLRESDLVARWGGEEFIFLLPETDESAAMAVAEKVREAVAATTIQLPDRVISVTITVGLASIGTGMQLEQCSTRADAALYEGKRSGKNRVVAAA